MKNAVIRRLRIEDLDEIQSFCYQHATQSNDPLGRLRIPERQYAWEMKRIRQDWLAQQRYIAYVAEATDDGGRRLVGYGAAVLTEQPHFFDVEMMAAFGELWVAPDCRNQGIGKALADAVLKDVRDMGITWITVHLGGNEIDVRPFFEKLGFDEGAVEMRKSLSQV